MKRFYKKRYLNLQSNWLLLNELTFHLKLKYSLSLFLLHSLKELNLVYSDMEYDERNTN